MEERVDRLLDVVEKFQDQVSTLISALHVENTDQTMTGSGNQRVRLVAPIRAESDNQFGKMIKSSNDEVDPRELEKQQQNDTGAGPRLKTRRKAKQVTEVTTKVTKELEEEIEVIAWDDASPIRVTTEQMREAFAKNPVLREYASLNTTEMTDPKKAPPYVLEVLMDLVRRGHAEPEARNVQLNPARADQVRVKTGETWEVRELVAVARFLLEAVSRAMKKSTLSDEERQKLELDVQDAVAWAWQLYEESPSEYARAAQKPLAAHLVNMAPSPEK
jgi:hypothetical protein